MVFDITRQNETNTLTRISLICTILALDVSNSLFQTMVNDSKGRGVEYGYQLINTVFNSRFILQSNTALREIALLLLQALNVTFNYEISPTQRDNQEIEIERFKQYLRKFTFFFHTYIRSYPNELSTLSTKKTNMLAIKNLFLISGL